MVHVKGLRLIFGEMRYPNLVFKNDCLKLWCPCTSDSAVLLRKKILFQIKKRRYLPHS